MCGGRGLKKAVVTFRHWYRSLHHTTGGRSNSEIFWNSLSSKPPLAASDGAGMELSKARTSGSGKGRGEDRALEDETLASNKKKPPHLETIWHFSMKVVFCSSPLFAENWCRRVRLPSCIIATSGREFRPFRPLPSRPSGDMCRLIPDFKERILRSWTWRVLSPYNKVR